MWLVPRKLHGCRSFSSLAFSRFRYGHELLELASGSEQFLQEFGLREPKSGSPDCDARTLRSRT